MKTFFQALLWMQISLMALPNHAVLQTAPEAEPVYGGYLEWIDAISLDPTQTRVFTSTRSPNSMFYQDISGVNTLTPSFGGWNTIPDLDETDNFGFIRCFAVDENSGYAYVGTEGGQFLGTSITAGSRFTIGSFFVEAVEAKNGKLFYERRWGGDEYLWICNLNSSGQIIGHDSTRIAISPGWMTQFRIRILISPYDDHVYVFVPGTPPKIYKSSDTYTALSHTTTWSSVTVTDLAATGKEYLAMGIAPDGRIFVGSYEGNSSAYTAQVSYSDADGDPWTTVIVNHDCGRGNISITANSSAAYQVYFSRVISSDKGLTWNMHGGADGAVCADPENDQFAYVRTDWGSGFYNNSIPGVTETNDGLLAVQVNDFDMDETKNTAWVASKSGIWHVSNYSSLIPVWSNPLWPQGSTVPWTEVECSVTADTLFCGNNDADMFRYEGASGPYTDPSSYELVFRAIDIISPYYHWTYGTNVSAIGTDPYYSGERVFVGLYDAEDFYEPESFGAVFAGVKTGVTWTFSQITGGTLPNTGIDVNAMAVVTENGHTVVYVGVERNTTYATVNGIYRMEETAPGTWLITNDLFTGPGYPISATIADIKVTPDGFILACGTDASGTTVVSYKKAIGSTYWTVLPTSGLTPPNTGRAITYDEVNADTYMAVDNSIYKLASGASSWTNYWTYPVGTEIQFIYYDDLLVGTGTGLYVHGPTTGIDRQDRYSGNRLNVTAYPNPFAEQVKFTIEIEETGVVQLEIFDQIGRAVVMMENKHDHNGRVYFTWNAEQSGNGVIAGVYFYRVKIGTAVRHGKVILAR